MGTDGLERTGESSQPRARGRPAAALRPRSALPFPSEGSQAAPSSLGAGGPGGRGCRRLPSTGAARRFCWRLRTPGPTAQTPSGHRRHLPHRLPQPTYTQAGTGPSVGPADLSPASLAPRQQSWGLTHWRADSHGSHLCAFVCVRPPATALPALRWLFLLLRLPLHAPHAALHAPRAHTYPSPSAWGRDGQGTPGNRLPLTLAQDFPSPSSPVTEPLRLSLRNPRPTEVPCLRAWLGFWFPEQLPSESEQGASTLISKPVCLNQLPMEIIFDPLKIKRLQHNSW